MQCYNGKAAFQGVDIGKIVEFKKEGKLVKRIHIENTDFEKKRFFDAQTNAMQQLDQLYKKALKEVGQTNAEIFEVHKMMLEDEDFVESIENIIVEQSVNAEYAVAAAGDNFSQMFAATEDTYMKERATDVKDISERLVRILSGESENAASISEGTILVADDLVPSETVQLDKNKVVAFVTREGSTNSHTAILARTMNIPAIVNVPIPKDLNGKKAIVNGMNGTVLVQPDEETITKYKNLQQEEIEKQKLLQEYKGRHTVTKSSFMPILEAYRILGQSCKMMQLVLDCSEVNFYIYRKTIIHPKKNSFKYINKLLKQWLVKRSLYEPWTLEQINRLPILIWTKKKILLWAIGHCESALQEKNCLKPS